MFIGIRRNIFRINEIRWQKSIVRYENKKSCDRNMWWYVEEAFAYCHCMFVSYHRHRLRLTLIFHVLYVICVRAIAFLEHDSQFGIMFCMKCNINVPILLKSQKQNWNHTCTFDKHEREIKASQYFSFVILELLWAYLYALHQMETETIFFSLAIGLL